MGRLPRVYVPGLSLHVFQRGHNRGPVFEKDRDYEHFLWLVKDASARHNVDVHGFTVMTNHYHLIATPGDRRALPRTMQAISGGYVRYYNRTRHRSGTIWNGRYSGTLIEDERYWLTCLRYIEQNPVRAKMVSAPELYKWTSYHVHACGSANRWLVLHPLYLRLGSCPAERQRAYRELVSDTVVN